MSRIIHSFNSFFLIITAIVFLSCNEQEDIEPQGTVSFEVNNLQNSSSGGAINDAQSIALTIIDGFGDFERNAERINVIQNKDECFSEKIALKAGSYEIRGFVLLNAQNNAIFMSPKKDSEFAELVKNPLSVSFTVSAGTETKVSVEVLSTSLGDSSSFGYKDLDFDILDPLTDRLIAFFDFRGDANDQVGSRSGEVNGATLTEDRFLSDSAAYFFDGTDDYIEMGDVLDLDTGDFSFIVHVKVNEFAGLKPGTGTRGADILSKGTTIFGTPRRAGYALKALELDGQNTFSFTVGSQNNEIFSATTTTSFETDKWYAIACTKSQDSIKMYVNAQLVASNAIPSGINLDNNIPFVVGSINKLGNDSEGTSYFSGEVDDIRFYRKELTSDIARLSR